MYAVMYGCHILSNKYTLSNKLSHFFMGKRQPNATKSSLGYQNFLYRNDPKFSYGQVKANWNSVDPDQTAPKGAVWLGSTLLKGAVWLGSTLFAVPPASFGCITLS